MNAPPEEKKLRTTSFAAHVTRGLIRDQRTRRVTMGLLLAVAVVMIIVGSSLFETWLNEHVIRFILFWLVCGWLTVTALLLALFDLLMLRLQARAARNALRQEATGAEPEN